MCVGIAIAQVASLRPVLRALFGTGGWVFRRSGSKETDMTKEQRKNGVRGIKSRPATAKPMLSKKARLETMWNG